ncbi:hypothetical protein B0T21DRAFT_277736 [Apiosordaria backusii]|uniref:Uncharacterized protein n=1 Tax=Apiosordaria backusii TaxID=314023 RepID=A0AA40K771_9PEZI|nr:hypothetical protein B0T21DRAFT_277736 [Apiosordaria backusii]
MCSLFSILLLNGILAFVLLTTVFALNVEHPATVAHAAPTARSVDTTSVANTTSIDEFTFHPQPVPCGEVNLLLVGIPPYHPLVKAGGFDPRMIEAILTNDTDLLVASGYNVRMLLFGPEQPLSVLQEQMADVSCWHGTGVGFGERGTTDEALTVRFEETIHFFRNRVPKGPIMFNSSPTTFLPTLQRHFPIRDGVDCKKVGTPGKLLVGFIGGERGENEFY